MRAYAPPAPVMRQKPPGAYVKYVQPRTRTRPKEDPLDHTYIHRIINYKENSSRVCNGSDITSR